MVPTSATISVLLLWGFSSDSSQAVVWVFTIMYGIFAGGFTALWTGVAKELQCQDRYRETGTAVLLGFYAAGRGVGNVISGPVSEQLLHRHVFDAQKYAYGGKYGPLIIFTGVTAFASSIGWAAKFVRPVQNLQVSDVTEGRADAT